MKEEHLKAGADGLLMKYGKVVRQFNTCRSDSGRWQCILYWRKLLGLWQASDGVLWPSLNTSKTERKTHKLVIEGLPGHEAFLELKQFDNLPKMDDSIRAMLDGFGIKVTEEQ